MISFAPKTLARAAVLMAAALVVCAVGSLSAHKTVVSPFTYYQDVRPLFERSCASCHDQRSVSPKLLQYGDAMAAYRAIERALLAGARPEHGPQLTHIEFDLIMTWAAGGTPEGARPRGAPEPPPGRHLPHSGQLGGLLVPIAGDTLHAEAIFSEQRRLRVVVTTPSGDPIASERLRALRMSVKMTDGTETLFAVSKAGDALEARVPTMTLPATFVVVERGGVPQAVVFSSYSVAPAELEIPPTAIPPDDPGRIAAINAHAGEAMDLVSKYRYGQLFLPTTHVRDVLTAMRTPSAERDRALRQLMRANWALHLAGDNGLPREARDAAATFDAARTALAAAYAK